MYPASRSLVKARHIQRFVGRGQRFLQRRPLLAKGLPTAIGFAFGDFLTQYFNRNKDKPFQYDPAKGATMLAVGAVVATPVGLGFLRWMDLNILPHNPTGAAALSIKFTLDQVLGCIIWQIAYCSICESYRTMLLGFLQEAGNNVHNNLTGFRTPAQV